VLCQITSTRESVSLGGSAVRSDVSGTGRCAPRDANRTPFRRGGRSNVGLVLSGASWKSVAYEADLARFATVSLPTGTLLQKQRLSWSGISLCGWHVAIWLNFACCAICFWWMHKLSSRQETMLRELQEQAQRIEHLSKAEHQLLQ
jgi:hypothetical protein